MAGSVYKDYTSKFEQRNKEIRSVDINRHLRPFLAQLFRRTAKSPYTQLLSTLR